MNDQEATEIKKRNKNIPHRRPPPAGSHLLAVVVVVRVGVTVRGVGVTVRGVLLMLVVVRVIMVAVGVIMATAPPLARIRVAPLLFLLLSRFLPSLFLFRLLE